MYPQNFEEFPPPPGIMGSLRAGFDAVSRHVGLILLPLVLDLLLWLGPRLSVSGLERPTLPPTLTSLAGLKQLMDFQAGANEAMEHFNLLSIYGSSWAGRPFSASSPSSRS